MTGFGVIIKGGKKERQESGHRNVADRVFPTKETLSKPSYKHEESEGSCMHGPKHHGGGGMSKPKGHGFAISIAVGPVPDKKKKKQEETKKALLAPGEQVGSSTTWRPAPRSKLNRMRLWNRKYGKWVYRDRTSEDDTVWGTPAGGVASPPPPKKQEKELSPLQVTASAPRPVKEEKKPEQESGEVEQQMVRQTSSKLDKLLKEKKEEKDKEKPASEKKVPKKKKTYAKDLAEKETKEDTKSVKKDKEKPKRMEE